MADMALEPLEPEDDESLPEGLPTMKDIKKGVAGTPPASRRTTTASMGVATAKP